jgi:ABC-type uncharacterized transport system involved in gliding motility auxiliary subunit
MKNEPTSARSSRRSAGLQSALNLLLVIFILLVVNYLGFKYYAHRDLSTSQFYTLSGKTADVLHKLDSPVHITTILVNNQNMPYWDQTQNLLKEYQRVGGKNVNLDKLDPVYDRAAVVTLQERLHFSGTDNLIVFEYKDRSQMVKQGDLLEQDPQTGQVGGYKGEQLFTGAIITMIEGKSSKVYFTAGHGEHPMSDTQTAGGYGLITQSLKGENVTTDNLNLAATGSVPADADAVIIAGPSVPFSAAEAQALDKYLESNGKLFVLLDPLAPLGLDDLLHKYSLSYDNDIVLFHQLTSTGQQTTLPMALIYQTGFAAHPITEKFPAAGYYLAIADARSVRTKPDSSPTPKAQALMSTTADTWGWVMKPNMTSADLAGYATRSFDRASDLPGPLAIAAVYDAGMVSDPATKAQKTGTRLVVVGSAHFLENDTADQVAQNFFINAVDWLVKKDAVLDISPKRPQQYGVTLSPMSQRTVTWTSLIFVPGLALALGLFTWFSRRK